MFKELFIPTPVQRHFHESTDHVSNVLDFVSNPFDQLVYLLFHSFHEKAEYVDLGLNVSDAIRGLSNYLVPKLIVLK